jgi:GNAT superfamily N-acetyltransferase
MISIRQITDPSDSAIAAFGRLQESVYYAPETLIPAQYVPAMLSGPTGARMNVLLVAESDGQVVGGALFHAFRQTQTGFSSFLGVSREHRGEGIARLLHVARFEALERVLARPVHGVFIDVVSRPNGGPVTILDLLYCPRQPAASVPTDVVVETMRAYWSPWLGADRASRHADALRQRARHEPSIALLAADEECNAAVETDA